MEHEKTLITAITPLINNFFQVQLAISFPEAQPGHYIMINDTYPCYIKGQQQGIELIVDATIGALVSSTQEITISPLQGSPLPTPAKNQFYLVIVENLGLNACLFYLKKYRRDFQGLVFIGSDGLFPFVPCPSQQLIPDIPDAVIAGLPLLEDWEIPHRLTSRLELPGVYHGTALELAEQWMAYTSITDIQKLVIPSIS
jgi:hypothetical protein